MYNMMTAKEVIDMLWDQVGRNRKVDFTFDDLNLDPECDPEGWYGVKLMKIFDEPYGVIAFGYYGGGSTEIYDIEQLVEDDESDEIIKAACTDKLQEFINYWCGLNNGCEKVCVEVKRRK